MSNSISDQETESAVQIILAGEKPNEFSSYDYKTALAKALEEHRKNKIVFVEKSEAFKCHLCDYKSLRRFNFDEHMREHTGESPYSCDVCGYKTIHKRCHRVHQLTHAVDRQYECSICQYRTTELNCFQKHKRRHTLDKAAQLFICGSCDYSTVDKRTLRLHVLKMHSNKKKMYECQLCDYLSPRPSDVRRHVLTHSTNKERLCDYCETLGEQCTLTYESNSSVSTEIKLESLNEECSQGQASPVILP